MVSTKYSITVNIKKKKKSQNSSTGPRKPFVGNKKHQWLQGAYKPEQRSPRGGKIPTYCNFLLYFYLILFIYISCMSYNEYIIYK